MPSSASAAARTCSAVVPVVKAGTITSLVTLPRITVVPTAAMA
jgi:hypothetical protein